MKPRLPSSKKWTPFPAAYQSQIEQVFSEAFAPQMQQGQLVVEGRIYSHEICLRIGYLAKGRLEQNNFEVSMDYSSETKDAVERIHDCIDAVASLMNEFFVSEGEVEYPRTWKNFDFEGKIMWVQYNTVNTNLEAEANRLLGIEEKESLVQEHEDVEDAEEGDLAPSDKRKLH